MVDYD